MLSSFSIAVRSRSCASELAASSSVLGQPISLSLMILRISSSVSLYSVRAEAILALAFGVASSKSHPWHQLAAAAVGGPSVPRVSA